MDYPNVTKQDYIQALIKVRDKHHISKGHKSLEMLQAHAKSEGGVITATKLGEAVGYPNYSTANLHYGKYAHLIADELGYTPSQRPDNTYLWWMTIAAGNLASDDTIDGHFEFVMHPALLEALREMKWVK